MISSLLKFMKILICILSIWVFLKNMSFAVYEYKENRNVSGSITVIILNIICLIFCNIFLWS